MIWFFQGTLQYINNSVVTRYKDTITSCCNGSFKQEAWKTLMHKWFLSRNSKLCFKRIQKPPPILYNHLYNNLPLPCRKEFYLKERPFLYWAESKQSQYYNFPQAIYLLIKILLVLVCWDALKTKTCIIKNIWAHPAYYFILVIIMNLI